MNLAAVNLWLVESGFSGLCSSLGTEQDAEKEIAEM
jgi:hypothetical protein